MLPIVAFLVLSSLALAGTTDDSIPDAAYLKYGEGFAPYTKTVRVVESTGAEAKSSAVCVSGRYALTAAHVVEDAKTGSVGSNAIDRVFVHQDFESRRVGWFDIAVIRVKGDFGLDYYPRLSGGNEKPGDIVTIAGYGLSGRLSKGHTISDERLRAGTNRIDRFEKTLLICPATRGGSPMPFCIAPGDSGGPLFVGSGPDARLCGIASFTMKVNGPLASREGEEMAATRVAYFKEWVEQIISEKSIDAP